MSTILNNIKQIVSSAIKVEVKNPVIKNGKKRYPVVVTDMGQSLTSGWSIKYLPTAQNNGQRLYDGSQTFSTLYIYKFSKIHNLILTANHYFLENINVEVMLDGRRRAIYEPDNKIRLTVTSQSNSVVVVLTVIDEESPFYMMSIPFKVVLSNDNSGNYYVIGSEDRWDRTIDMFTESNANFAPGKARYYRVHQSANQPPTLSAKIANNNGQFQIHPNGSFTLDVEAAPPEWIQVITNEYKALAYIYEQVIMEVAFEKALEQGLPGNEPNQISFDDFQETPFEKQGGFIPAFNLNNQAPTVSEDEQPIITLPNEPKPPVTPGRNVTLPWT
ncbi:hypothetical protein [Bacillus atrophaeus]|uniref:hypothetical protein n=1 Tax=Bacillus atrophaeus TaxID=1452 RepID=UPI0022809ACE|nr:hypothetical protein [Bacillus atrophaeus]MCY8466507.1 hypothetical protein [Bacillus atrophaeus]MCY8478966.1 hypothetical protein [Bacillus atrophaeus]